MEKLNIVWIKKWKIKRNLISVMTKIKAFFEKRNWNYVSNIWWSSSSIHIMLD